MGLGRGVGGGEEEGAGKEGGDGEGEEEEGGDGGATRGLVLLLLLLSMLVQ